MREKSNSVDNYILELYGPIEERFEKIEKDLKKENLFGINIGPAEGIILSFLMRTHNVQTVLEIGTQYGYSTLWLLQYLPQNGKLVSIEKNPIHYQKAKDHIRDDRCTFFCDDAKNVLKNQLANESFDLVFIDANKKSYPQYLEYAKEHVPVGGLIVGDNTFLMNSVFAENGDHRIDPSLVQAMRRFNQELFSDNRFASCIIPTKEGLTIGYKLREH